MLLRCRRLILILALSTLINYRLKVIVYCSDNGGQGSTHSGTATSNPAPATPAGGTRGSSQQPKSQGQSLETLNLETLAELLTNIENLDSNKLKEVLEQVLQVQNVNVEVNSGTKRVVVTITREGDSVGAQGTSKIKVQGKDLLINVKVKEGNNQTIADSLANCVQTVKADSSVAPTDGSQPKSPPTSGASAPVGADTATKTKVELDIKGKKATDQYSYNKSGNVGTYEAKGNNAFNKVKTGDNEIWKAENDNSKEYSTKVVVDGIGKKTKTVTVHLNGSTKKYKKEGKDKPWSELSSSKPASGAGAPLGGASTNAASN